MKKPRWKPVNKHRKPTDASGLTYREFRRIMGNENYASRELLSLPRMAQNIYVSASIDSDASSLEGQEKANLFNILAFQRLRDAFPAWRPEEVADLMSGFEATLNKMLIDSPDFLGEFLRRTKSMSGWYLDGMQVISVGDVLAAQLCATRIARQVLETVKLPWSSFVVRISEGLIYYKDFDGSRASVTDILVSEVPGLLEPFFLLQCLGTSKVVLLRGTSSGLAALLDAKYSIGESDISEGEIELFLDQNPGTEPDMLHKQEMDDRAVQLCKNLVGALLVHFQENHLRLEAQGDFSGFDQEKNRKFPKPLRHVFEGKMPVKLDARKVIKEYSMHGGKSPSVQTLVMGHWKMQPHGPRSTLRKRIYRAPYWKGNPAAKIALRPHTL